MRSAIPSRWPLVTLFLISVGVIVAIFLTRLSAQAAPPQPIAFSHATHAGAGVQCLFCHPSALQSSIAGIPSVQKCMGCHSVIETDSEQVQTVAGYWERGEPIPWNRVQRQPDFVYFSHEPHLSAGTNCETCHGDVSRMDVAHPVVRMDMGWCLDCHLEQPEENAGRLADCVTCHK